MSHQEKIVHSKRKSLRSGGRKSKRKEKQKTQGLEDKPKDVRFWRAKGEMVQGEGNDPLCQMLLRAHVNEDCEFTM